MSIPAQPEPLRVLRERAGLSQRDLAQRAGVAATTIRNAETGTTPYPAYREAIDRALGAALVIAPIRERLAELERATAELDAAVRGLVADAPTAPALVAWSPEVAA